jgi:hypothetical protein
LKKLFNGFQNTIQSQAVIFENNSSVIFENTRCQINLAVTERERESHQPSDNNSLAHEADKDVKVVGKAWLHVYKNYCVGGTIHRRCFLLDSQAACQTHGRLIFSNTIAITADSIYKLQKNCFPALESL